MFIKMHICSYRFSYELSYSCSYMNINIHKDVHLPVYLHPDLTDNASIWVSFHSDMFISLFLSRVGGGRVLDEIKAI